MFSLTRRNQILVCLVCWGKGSSKKIPCWKKSGKYSGPNSYSIPSKTTLAGSYNNWQFENVQVFRVLWSDHTFSSSSFFVRESTPWGPPHCYSSLLLLSASFHFHSVFLFSLFCFPSSYSFLFPSPKSTWLMLSSIRKMVQTKPVVIIDIISDIACPWVIISFLGRWSFQIWERWFWRIRPKKKFWREKKPNFLQWNKVVILIMILIILIIF